VKKQLKIQRPKKAWTLKEGKPRPVMVFETYDLARAFETAKSGVRGWIEYDGKFREVRSSYDGQKKWPGPWVHVFIKPIRKRKGLMPVVTQHVSYQPPSTLAELKREVLKKAEQRLKTTKRNAIGEVRNAQRALSVARKMCR